MGFFGGVKDAVSSAVSQATDAAKSAAEAGKSAFEEATKDPIGCFGNPASKASEFVDASLQKLGMPAKFRAMATFALDPLSAVRDAAIGGLKEGVGLVAAGGKVVNDSLKVLGDSVVKTPGGFSISAGFEGKAIIVVGGKGWEAGGSGEVNVSFDPTKDRSFGPPGGKLIDIVATAGQRGQQFACQLLDGTKLAWEVIKDGASNTLQLPEVAIGCQTAGGLGAVVMGPFREALANVRAGIGKVLDGQVDVRTHGELTAGGVFGSNRGNRQIDPGGPPNIRQTPETTETSRSGGTGRTGGTDAAYGDLLGDLNGLNDQIAAKRDELAKASPEDRNTIALELQGLLQERLQLISTISNLLKQEHDAAMAVINNLRG